MRAASASGAASSAEASAMTSGAASSAASTARGAAPGSGQDAGGGLREFAGLAAELPMAPAGGVRQHRQLDRLQQFVGAQGGLHHAGDEAGQRDAPLALRPDGDGEAGKADSTATQSAAGSACARLPPRCRGCAPRDRRCGAPRRPGSRPAAPAPRRPRSRHGWCRRRCGRPRRAARRRHSPAGAAGRPGVPASPPAGSASARAIARRRPAGAPAASSASAAGQSAGRA